MASKKALAKTKTYAKPKGYRLDKTLKKEEGR